MGCRCPGSLVLALLALVVPTGCAKNGPGGPTPTTETAVRCGDAPGASNVVIAQFSRPFSGSFPLSNYFDHDRPFQFQDTNGYQLNACGERVSGRIDGHSGYDWVMPVGTPLRAV